MDVVQNGPCPVGSLVWQPRRDAWVATIVCKATFVLKPSLCELAPAQDPLNEQDLIPVKPSAEVLVVGLVYAPERRPVTSIVARVSVGEVSKAVEAFQDAELLPDGSIVAGEPFAQMPLVYERAAGGAGTSNPVGRRRDARDGKGAVALPNLRPPGTAPASFEPTGLGPIAATWPDRAARLPAYPPGWSPRDLARAPLPEAMDLTFFNTAPPDQLLRSLVANERVVLENLHGEHALLVTSLPGLAAVATVERQGGAQPLSMRADTLCIDTERGLCTLTFRGAFALQGAAERLRVVVTIEAPRAMPPTVAIREKAEQRGSKLGQMTADIPLAFRRQAALPFAGGPAASTPEPARIEPAAPSSERSPWGGSGGEPPPQALASLGTSAVTTASPREAALPHTEATQTHPVVELLWFSPEAAARLRRRSEFQSLLEEAERRSPDPEADDPALATDPAGVDDRRDIFEVIARARPTDAAGLAALYARAARADGRHVAAVALVAGELELPFDETAELATTLAIVAPVALQDDGLKSACAAARNFLVSSEGATVSGVAAAFTARITAALAAAKRVTTPLHLEAHRERALVEARRHQRRRVFGGQYVRALLTVSTLGGDGRPASNGAIVPAYLLDEVVDSLPLSSSMRVKLVAEVRPSVDPRESSHLSLRVLAVGRVVGP